MHVTCQIVHTCITQMISDTNRWVLTKYVKVVHHVVAFSTALADGNATVAGHREAAEDGDYITHE